MAMSARARRRWGAYLATERRFLLNENCARRVGAELAEHAEGLDEQVGGELENGHGAAGRRGGLGGGGGLAARQAAARRG